jgi:hypothetical protein
MAKKAELDFREVSASITLFTPYPAGYAHKCKGRYWTTSGSFLKDELVRFAIDGKGVIGFKAMYRSAVFGLDVDDHEHGEVVASEFHDLARRIGRVLFSDFCQIESKQFVDYLRRFRDASRRLKDGMVNIDPANQRSEQNRKRSRM